MRYDVQILDMGYLLIQSCKFVEVCCKETEGMDLRGNISEEKPINGNREDQDTRLLGYGPC